MNLEQQLENLPSDIEIEHELGGSVFKGKWKNKVVAIKRLKFPQEVTEWKLRMLKSEIETRKHWYHPNIVTLYELILGESDQPSLLVLEYMTRGSLFHHLHQSNLSLPLVKQVEIATNIASALVYLHHLQPKVIHKNLKSSK